jgi:hypothetical protein
MLVASPARTCFPAATKKGKGNRQSTETANNYNSNNSDDSDDIDILISFNKQFVKLCKVYVLSDKL